MGIEHVIVGGGVVVIGLGLAIYLFRLYLSRHPAQAAKIQAAAAVFKPVEAAAVVGYQTVEPTAAELLVKLTDMIDAKGKLVSAMRHTDKLADAAADGHDAKFAAALGPKDQPSPPAS